MSTGRSVEGVHGVMYIRDMLFHRRVLNALFLALAFLVLPASLGVAAEVNVVIDGQRVVLSPRPMIQNGRTLVPVRALSEALKADVQWYPETRTVVVTKGERTVKLTIDDRLFSYTEGMTVFGLSDVPPQIFGDRTFVPLRLVSNALGITVTWSDIERTVYVDSKTPGAYTPFYDVTLPSIRPGQLITGITDLRIEYGSMPPSAVEVRYLLLDPETGRGPVIARGSDLKGTYRWLPDITHNGARVLAAATYDKDGRFVAGTVVPVEVGILPRVELRGLTQRQVVRDSVSLSVGLNFVAQYVKYEIINRNTGSVMVTEEMDPQGSFIWTPQVTDNGYITVRAIAYDRADKPYSSDIFYVRVAAEPKVALGGVSPGASVAKPVTLWLSRNFPVSQVEYVIKDTRTEEEQVLARMAGYSSYRWFPTPEQAGNWSVLARVTDAEGNTYTSNAITVQVPGEPRLLLEGVGPGQVLTGTVNLKASSNVSLSAITYHLINPKTGERRTIAGGTNPDTEYSFTPSQSDAGAWQVQAVGTTSSGDKILSEAVPVTIYLGPIHGPKPIIEKNLFLEFAAGLAVESQRVTGMSASLQVAQAILETGWGQYTPVDKYTGKVSYNLFGIKGQGPAGSVTSNTWEEYNGVVYRVDAAFRAYNNTAESWADHKRLLLTASRYEPFRAVMHDSTQGAWALRRAGYATDSKYPIKLINLIKQYNLDRLDQVRI